MTESLEMSVMLPVSAKRLYNAWLDGDEHSAFTGGAAHIDPEIGGAFSAWDGYIEGVTMVLEPYKRIVQTWRATDFPSDALDSRIELLFEAVDEGARLTLRHTDLPEGQSVRYERGWSDYYFTPMREYFGVE